MTRTLFRVALLGLELGGMPRANTYASATIGNRFFGRSRRIPQGADFFDLSKEPIAWEAELLVDGDVIPIRVEIWDDEGDRGSVRLTTIAADISAPPFEQTLDVGMGLRIRARVSSREVPASPSRIYAARTPEGEALRATVRIPNTVVVELADVRGLRRPVAIGRPGFARAEVSPGYTGEDNLGRIYLNHAVDGTWRRNHQAIELVARVVPVRGVVPRGLQLCWTVVDVDDPTDADPGMHAEWRSYVDPADHARNGGERGARGRDNRGRPVVDPPWEAAPDFSLERADSTTATTTVVRGESRVVLHCPGRAGSNLVVKVDVQPQEGLESFPATTGTMTMWHRLDVENIRMQSAFELPLENVPQRFEPMCVQLDFAEERVIPDQRYLATDDNDLELQTARFVDSVFCHKDQPGWFCVLAALEPYAMKPKAAGPSGSSLPVVRARLGHEFHRGSLFEFADIDGHHPDVTAVRLGQHDRKVYFGVDMASPFVEDGLERTRLYLDEHDLQPDFTAGDGSKRHAYKHTYLYGPRFTRRADGSTNRGGFGFGEEVDVALFRPGEENYAIGISPYLVRGGMDYFAGRTCMFTHHREYRDATTGGPRDGFADYFVTVVGHELIHAFGMPHKCGYFDFRAPRNLTCCMNYSSSWMIDERHELRHGTGGRCGKDVCGRHLEEIRAVRLHDNKGLNW